ncbi:MAG TPA: helix-turn-helix domain-containing protein [Sporichthyaceae bacterium]|jgi:AraC-like DNA-binding protein|nr:helix-turn-helix domain-containing protein [Sporichthyaceae bacterium]
MGVGNAIEATRTGRVGVWRDIVREHFVTLDVDTARIGHFEGVVDTGAIAHLRVSEVSSVTQGINRTRTFAQQDGVRYLQVGLITRGRGHVVQDGRECTLGPGDFTVYETDRPFFWGLSGDATARWNLLVFTWPRTAVALTEQQTAALTAHHLSGHDGLTGLVSRMLRDVATSRPEPTEGGAVKLADQLADLVLTAAAEACPTGLSATESDLLARIEQYLLANLGDPTLSPDSIAAAHFISTRHLQRLFAARGRTVSQSLREARLEACRRDLLAAGPAGSIAGICRRHGFTDAAVFSRAFRAAYGTSPSGYRALIAR